LFHIEEEESEALDIFDVSPHGVCHIHYAFHFYDIFAGIEHDRETHAFSDGIKDLSFENDDTNTFLRVTVSCIEKCKKHGKIRVDFGVFV